MPELIGNALAHPGFVWLFSAALVAGVVRGFAGFGTAMIFMPVAGQWVSPVLALVLLTIMDAFGPLPNLPRALREGHRRDAVLLIVGVVLAMPAGLWLLTRLPGDVFRYGVSLVSLVLLLLLVAGWRYRGVLSRGLIAVTGALGGFMGGLVGLAGPPVIMLYMASELPARVVRANLILYLMGVDVMLLLLLGFGGHIGWYEAVLGLLVMLPYLVGNVLGALIFRPELEGVYRRVAYGIIAVSALSGLPLFD